jgi:hypothetical protein
MMKVIEKPTINMTEFTKTVRSRDASFALSRSSEVPEIMEIYPGTRGRTHGDRNEMSPAANA